MSDQYSGPKVTTSNGSPATYRKPMPRIDVWNKPFWDATREHQFLAQQDEDGNTWFPPGPMSPFNHSDRWTWVALNGRGRVLSWVVFHQKYFAGFGEELPYNVALVQLAEGPVVFTNLSGISNDKIEIGMQVKVEFSEMDGTMNLPVFRPVDQGETS